MKLKKLCSIALAATMLFGGTALLPEDTFTFGTSITASAEVNTETSGKCGDNVSWSLSNDGVLTISGTGDMYNYDTSPFYQRDDIKSVIIKSGVTSIGDKVFTECKSITSVTIPNSVTSIGGYAFSKTKWLENQQKKNPLVVVNGILIDGSTCEGEVTIPNSVKSIGDYAFEGCKKLTSITIPKSVTSIGLDAFSGSGLTSITIPNSVTSIGDSAFSGCTSLTSVTIPSSVKSIGGFAFAGCTSLTSVTIPSSVKSIGGFAFAGCTSLTSVVIPSSVTSIDDYVFSGCTSLTSVTIPKSVTSIGSEAFKGTKWLENKQKQNPLVIVNGILIDGKKCSGNVTIPSSVTSIGDCAFYGCSNLSSITIPTSVTSIGKRAFEGCEKLISITIPNSVTSIGENAFEDCTSLTSINIPSSVTSISSCAFWGCTNLSSVTIPSSVTNIGERAFYKCTSLTRVTIPDGVISISDYAFLSCSNLTSVTIPDSVISIGDKAFSYYYNEDFYDYSYDDYPYERIDGFTIKGVKGSAAEKYATDNDFAFEALAELKITKQPTNATALKAGDKISFTVEATGTGLKYEWYIKDVGGDWKKTSAATSSYSCQLTTARNGRQVFCKVIDSSGKFVRSNIAVGNIAGTVIVVEQPKDVTVWNAGDTANFTVKGAGHGLKYEWYVKDPGGNWIKTGAVESTYSISISKARNGRQVFCKIIDFKGRSVRTNVVKANIAGTVVIMEQPKNVTVAKAGDTATFTIKSVGHGMKYEWYVKDPKGNWTKTGATTNKYSVSITKARNGRQVFCKVIDFKNRSVRSNIVSAKIK